MVRTRWHLHGHDRGHVQPGSEVEQCPGLIALSLSFYADATREGAQIAEAKGDTKIARAPIRLMTQFLRAASENRMEDALALGQTSETCVEGICMPQLVEPTPWAC